MFLKGHNRISSRLAAVPARNPGSKEEWGAKLLNKLYPSGKHPEAVTRKIVRCYAEDLPLRRAARRVPLEEKQVGAIFRMIRQKVGRHLDELVRRHQSSQEWLDALNRHAHSVFFQIAGKYAAGLKVEGLETISYREMSDEERVRELETYIRENQKEFLEALRKQALEAIRQVGAEYVRLHAERKRGVRAEHYDMFQKEYWYRFIIFTVCRDHVKVPVEHSWRRFSNRVLSILLKDRVISKIFVMTSDQADIIEKDILTILERDPLP